MVHVDIKVFETIYKYKYETKYFNVYYHFLYIDIKTFTVSTCNLGISFLKCTLWQLFYKPWIFLSAVLLNNFVRVFECPLTMNITTLNDNLVEQYYTLWRRIHIRLNVHIILRYIMSASVFVIIIGLIDYKWLTGRVATFYSLCIYKH